MPTREPTENNSYTFDGWDKAFDNITGTTTVTAKFTEGTRKYNVTFKNWDGEVLETQEVEKGSGATAPTEPTKEPTAQYTFTFDSWDKAFDIITAETIITATYTQTTNVYTVTFNNYDGSEIKTEQVAYGSAATAPAHPTRDATVENTYIFDDWDKAFDNIVENTIVTAKYKESARKYTVTFNNFDGTLLKIEQVAYGSSATAPADPTQEATAQYTYTFSGWDKTFNNIMGTTIVTATYSQVTNKYTVTFKNYDGTELKTEQVVYGSAATAPNNPTRAANAQYTYTFSAWDKNFDNITGTTTVTATYSQVTNKYNVTFKNYDGTELKSEQVAYGSAATAPAEPTKEPTIEITYTFDAWDKAFDNIVEDIVVTAKFSESVRKYTVLFKDDDGKVLKSEQVPYVSGATAPTEITKKDHTFSSWDKTFTNITTETTVNAIWYTTGLVFAAIEGGYAVSCGEATSKKIITIPSLYNGQQVIYIAENGFSSALMETVIIPDTIAGMGGEAFYSCSLLKNVIFGDNPQITAIEAGLFSECESLTSITIPDRVTIIGDNAFSICSSLLSIAIPDNVISIGIEAFSGCSSLEMVTFGASKLLDIGDRAFIDCEELAFMAFPDSVTNIGNAAFVNTFLQKITFGANSRLTTIGDNAFYNCYLLSDIFLPSALVSIGSGAFGDETGGGPNGWYAVLVPQSIVSIGEAAFSNKTIYTDTVNILDSWADNCFVSCTIITGITIDSNTNAVLTIDTNTIYTEPEIEILSNPNHPFLIFDGWYIDAQFSGTKYDTLNDAINSETEIFNFYAAWRTPTYLESSWQQNKVVFSQLFYIPIYVIEITGPDANFFAQKTLLLDRSTVLAVECANEEDILSAIDALNYEYEGNYIYVRIPGTMVIANEYYSLEYILAGNIVRTSDAYFSGDYKKFIKYFGDEYDIVIPGGIEIIASDAFADKDIASVFIPDSAKSIKNNAFAYCYNLMTITFGANSQLLAIGENAFSNCENLLSVVFPDSLLSIGYSAFSNCYDLQTIAFGEDSELELIDDYAFFNCSILMDLFLPSSLAYIGEQAFSYNAGGKTVDSYSIVIPSSVTTILAGAFNNRIIYTDAAFELEGWSENCFTDCSVIWGVEFDLEGRVLSINPEDIYYSLSASIVDPVHSYYIFSGWFTNTNFSGEMYDTIQDAIDASAEGYLYARWKEPTELESYWQQIQVKTLFSHLFETKNSYINIVDRSDRGEIHMYYDASYLIAVQCENEEHATTVLNDLNALFAGVFDYVRIPNTFIIAMESYSLEHIFSGNIVKTDNAYYSGDYKRLIKYVGEEDDIIIPDGVEAIGQSAFSGQAISAVYIPASVRIIEDYAFDQCISLQTVTFAENSQLKVIGSGAFSHNIYLTSMILPSSLTQIRAYAFNRSSIASISIPDEVKIIGNSAFNNCEKLTTVTFGENSKLVSIGDAAFEYCILLTSISIPNSVETIGMMAFKNTGLQTVVFGNNSKVTSIGYAAFQHCRYITEITLPSELVTIGERAFHNCYALTAIIIPSKVTSIGIYAFDGCSKIVSVVIPAGVTIIGQYAFNSCSSINTVYYGGVDSVQWQAMEIGTANSFLHYSANRYYYSETEITGGTHWRFVDGVPTVWA